MTTRTSTTRTTTDARCHYDGAKCDSKLWECLTCRDLFCTRMHSHSTSKGENVECVMCERQRKEDEIPDPERELSRLHNLSEQAERLDIGDKPDYQPGR